MNSAFLDMIGLGGIDIGYILLGLFVLVFLLLIVYTVQAVKYSGLKKRYLKFMAGKNAKSLEGDIAAIFQDMDMVKKTIDRNKKDIRILYKNMESAFQKVGIVKYDAFNQMGGQLSFSLALLDENNNGFIINSVHSSEGCYSYTKEIIGGTCKISLGKEEAEALSQAMDKEVVRD